MKLKKGYIQIYTGNGKGKTTAALGVALRAAGAGLKTFIMQFMKEFPYSELESLKRLTDFIDIEQKGKDDFVYKNELPGKDEIKKAFNALTETKNKMLKKEYDIIILDEILAALYFKLIKPEDVLSFINEKPEQVELILTGRYAPKEIIDKADLVTEMNEIKHYYQQGVLSRKGIDS